MKKLLLIMKKLLLIMLIGLLIVILLCNSFIVYLYFGNFITKLINPTAVGWVELASWYVWLIYTILFFINEIFIIVMLKKLFKYFKKTSPKN